MIYIQNGPSWRPKVSEILENKLADGILWDPREETIDKVNEFKTNTPYLKLIDCF